MIKKIAMNCPYNVVLEILAIRSNFQNLALNMTKWYLQHTSMEMSRAAPGEPRSGTTRQPLS